MRNVLIFVLQIAFCLPLLAQPKIVITEIMYRDPAGFGGGIEYLELYNHDTVAVDMTGYTFTEGITYTFPATMLNPGEFILLTNDAAGFLQRYGMSAAQYTGFISNMGEDIALQDNVGVTIDSVDYEPNDPWPGISNGGGPSMVLCSPDADNNIAQVWQRAIDPIGIIVNGKEIFGNPGALSACHPSPVVQFEFVEASYNEGSGTIQFNVLIDSENSNATMVDVGVTSITATTPDDVAFVPFTVTFFGSTGAPQPVSLFIINDTMFEPNETFIVTLSNINNNALLVSDTLTITIEDNDAAVDKGLILTGIFDGSGNNQPSGVELYARQDIADLSIYGLGSANNGGGTDGQEYTFPAVSLLEGTTIYVTNDSTLFHNFFGFAADFVDNQGAIFITGDDAFEVFENNRVIDIYGDINVDGTGQVWQYDNGWGHRVDSTGPDCETFVPGNWEYSGTNVFDGITTNAMSTNPYPLNTFNYPITTMVSISNLVSSDAISIYPNPANGLLYIDSKLESDNVQIYTVSGAKVMEIDTRYGLSVLNISALQRGLYILKSNSGITQKVVIQ